MEPQVPPTSDKSDEPPLLTADEFRALVTRLGRNTNRIRTLRRAVFSISSIFYYAMAFWLCKHNTNPFMAASGAIAGNAIGMVYLNERRLRQDTRTAKRLIRFVMNTQDASLLGTILDLRDIAGSLGKKWKEINQAAFTAVLRLLPLLQPQDADILTTQHRERLRHYLLPQRVTTNWGNVYVYIHCLPVLAALEQIGDIRDLPDIERLLRADEIRDEKRTAAERCAQVIRERLVREENKDFLLRADRKPDAVETLLRPSAATADTPPQQLLRAATSEDGNTPA